MAQKYEKEEVLKIIEKLDKQGLNRSMIGMKLRDQYGIPNLKEYGIRISSTTKQKEMPEDLYSLLVKAVNVHNHMATNKKDATSKHGLEKVESKIRRLVKYYIRKGTLPKGWKYTIESARLLVK